MRAHCCGERGSPGASACGESLEHMALDQHLHAAALEKIDFVCAEVAEPFSQGCEGIARRQQCVEPFQRPVGCRKLSAAKVYGNRIYALNINVLS